jgi:hypothetical protein
MASTVRTGREKTAWLQLAEEMNEMAEAKKAKGHAPGAVQPARAPQDRP